MNLPYHTSQSQEVASHCASVVLSYIVKRQFSDAILVGGGTNSLGFYYDFIFSQSLADHLLEMIEVEFRTFIKENHEFRMVSMMRENAASFFEHQDHPLLAESIVNERENILSFLQLNQFFGVCPPNELTQTQEIGAVKILGKETYFSFLGQQNVQVTRLIGVVRENPQNLKIFNKAYDQFVKKRDHRVLGKQLNLFQVPVNQKNVETTWYSKGMCLKKILEDWVFCGSGEENFWIQTPRFTLKQKKSYGDLGPIFEEEENIYEWVRSLTPEHLKFFERDDINRLKVKGKSLGERALLYGEYSEAKRWGLLCSTFYHTTQTTRICSKEQLQSKLISSLHFIEQIATIFGFEAYWVLVITRQKTPKAKKEFEAIDCLKRAFRSSAFQFPLEEEIEESEKEIEGPRFELRIRDTIQRNWTVSSLGIVKHLAHFSSANNDGEKLIVIAESIWNSLDRYIALLIEKYEGVLPFWLAPEQVRILVVGEVNLTYAQRVQHQMQEKGLRVEIDVGQEKLGMKIHEAEKEKVPYMILIGEQEARREKISVRSIHRKAESQLIELGPFLDKLYQESLRPQIQRQQC